MWGWRRERCEREGRVKWQKKRWRDRGESEMGGRKIEDRVKWKREREMWRREGRIR